MRKTRPCLVISPDEMNRHLRTVLIAPMTTAERLYPTRVSLTFQGKHGQVALDQIRAVDRRRLVRRIGKASSETARAVSAVLIEMFARTTWTGP
jgi:mRNA interferase MazF